MGTNLFILHEKHGDRYFTYETEEDLERIALHVVKLRHEEDEFVDLSGREQASLKKALSGDGKAAYALLRMRSGWEYEGFQFDETEDYDGSES